jgi:hypothetical protein
MSDLRPILSLLLPMIVFTHCNQMLHTLWVVWKTY